MINTTNTKPFYNDEIPTDWGISNFASVFNFISTFSFSRENLTDEKTSDEIQYIHYGDIHAKFENEILDFETEKQIPFLQDGFISKDDLEDEEFPFLKDGDLIIADTSEDYAGVCECVELKNVNGRKIISGLHTFAARDTSDKTALGFRTYLFKNQQVVRELRRIATGISVYGVSKTNISKVKLPLPPLGEQKKIAEILSTWDKFIETTEKLIVAKQKLKKSLMQRLLTGSQRFPEFHGQEWTRHKIADLFEEVARYVKWSDEHSYKLVSIRRRFKGLFLRGDFFGHQIGVKKLKNIHSEDFLISKRQVSHGAWGVVTPEFHDTKVSDEYDSLIVKDKTKINVDFWGWLCKTPRMQRYSYLSSNGVHIEKLIFDFNDFRKRNVYVPSSIEEQKKIAAVLEKSDAEINVLQNKLYALRQQKRGLMQKLLTGETRVKVDEKDDAAFEN